MTRSFQWKPAVASSLKTMASSPPRSTPAFILLPWTASGPSRFAAPLLSLAPSSTWNPSTHLLLLHPQAAMRGLLRQHYRSQAVQYLFYLHLSDGCCCRSSSWAAVFCVLVLFVGVYVCAPTAGLSVLQLVRSHLHGIQIHVFMCMRTSDLHGKYGCYEPITVSSVL